MTLTERIRQLLDDGSEEALREVAELLWAAETGRAESYEPPEAPIGKVAIDWEALRTEATRRVGDEAKKEARAESRPVQRPLSNGDFKPLFLGYDATGRGIRLKPDQRKAHSHVIGGSGSGKSKYLEWLIRGQIRNREGFCLVDPHGPLYHDVLSYCAHNVVDREIVPLDLSNSHPVIGFNPFRRVPGGDVSVQVDNRIVATLHAWGMSDSDQTPTLERVLRLVYTAMIEADLTLPEAQHLIDFGKHEIRSQLIERIESPLVRQEWQEVQSYRRAEWRDEFLSTKNRLFRFLTSKTLCRFMGLPIHGIDLAEIMDSGKILLVNLGASDRWSRENARVFGSLLINEFFETARRRRKDDWGREPRPYTLYLDEFQNFVSLDIADMLDQVRKFGLFLVLAHQRFRQLDENVLESALTNCKIKAVFGGLTVENARTMAEELFIGKLDPLRVKAAIYQTKFWPEYKRDKVYSRSTSKGTTVGSSHTSGSGTSSGVAAGQFFGPGDWFGPGSGSSSVVTSGSSQMSATTDSESRITMESEGEADIPIFFPVPFKELSSVQYYTLEEQLTGLTAALKVQYQRHCFIAIHERDTQPMLVPFVPEPYTSEENFRWYEDKILHESGALPVVEVDQLIGERERILLESAQTERRKALPPADGKSIEKKGETAKRNGRTLFDAIMDEEEPGNNK